MWDSSLHKTSKTVHIVTCIWFIYVYLGNTPNANNEIQQNIAKANFVQRTPEVANLAYIGSHQREISMYLISSYLSMQSAEFVRHKGMDVNANMKIRTSERLNVVVANFSSVQRFVILAKSNKLFWMISKLIIKKVLYTYISIMNTNHVSFFVHITCMLKVSISCCSSPIYFVKFNFKVVHIFFVDSHYSISFKLYSVRCLLKCT